MAPTIEARAFVNEHVAAFSIRHRKKLNKVYPNKSVRELFQDSDGQHIVDAMDNLDSIDAEIEALIAKQCKANQDFDAMYGSVIHGVMRENDQARSKFLQEKQEAFDHKLRGAIGLVELVSTERAYELLEDCREQIRYMKAE